MNNQLNNKNILFTVWFADGFHGAVMHIFEISKYLISKGYNVYCVCKVLSNDIKSFYSKNNINLSLVEELDYTIKYDIIWNIHFPFLSYLLKNDIKYNKILYNCLSSFLTIETPPALYEDLSLIVANSEETKVRLVDDYSVKSENVYVLKNMTPSEFFITNKKLNSKIKKILIVSNHIPEEVYGVVKLFKQKNIKCVIYGMQDKSIQISPDVLKEADVIITIGKTVQYALSMGIPCYNYDYFGGSGYITLNNIDVEEFYNFSGRSYRTKKSSIEIAEDIIKNYPAVLNDIEQLRAIAKERYFLPVQIDKLLDLLENKTTIINKNKYKLAIDHDCCFMEFAKSEYKNKIKNQIFSIKFEYNKDVKHIIITILGVKMKFKIKPL